ncbi:hypothetical protein, partial [Anaerotignum sp.]|uniref:hypothetical protein n=1 Tax=Anaerotignum sp. TaxID=2039241 RepID=UPI003A83CD24
MLHKNSPFHKKCVRVDCTKSPGLLQGKSHIFAKGKADSIKTTGFSLKKGGIFMLDGRVGDDYNHTGLGKKKGRSIMPKKEKVFELLPVKRTEKKYIIFPASNQPLLAVFHAARHNSCFSMGVSTPKLRC